MNIARDFNSWLDTFLEEKGIDLEATFEFNNPDGSFNIMPYGVPVEFIKNANNHEKQLVYGKLVQIDFHNASVTDFLEYVGKWIPNA